MTKWWQTALVDQAEASYREQRWKHRYHPGARSRSAAVARPGARPAHDAHGAMRVWSDYEEKEVIMDNPALGLDSVIFGSFSCISLDSIMDSIDSSQIPLLIGRGHGGG